MRSKTTTLIAESVGALLQQAREEKKIPLAEVAFRTKIPERYLANFEDDAHGELADDVYTKIYLKAYGKFLGFETGTLLEHYRREHAKILGQVRPDRTARGRHPNISVPNTQLFVTPRVIQTALLGIVALSLVAYFVFQLTKIVAAPSITLSSPRDGLITTDRSVSVEGTTEGEVALVINGKSISPDDNGHFKDSLDLQEGVNVITVVGAKKYSKEIALTRRIIVLPKERPAALAPLGPPSPIQ